MITRTARLTCCVLGPVKGRWDPLDGEWTGQGDVMLEKRREVAEASATVDDEWSHVVGSRTDPAAELEALLALDYTIVGTRARL